MAIAGKHGLKVVEDAAQAIGAEYKGKSAGSFGNFGCFSFYPTKNLGAGGDAGIIVTDSKDDYELCRMLRVHGQSSKYRHRLVGYNSRLDTIQAAILLTKLPYLKRWSEKRNEHAKAYDAALAGVPNVMTPVVKEYTTFHIYNQYTLACTQRDSLLAGFRESGIGHCIYYPIPFHKQECFATLGYRPDDLPVSSKAVEEVLSIPVYPELTEEERSKVIETIKRVSS
jgi:dTDP-4-amino-4,6-dideoxygalactose transaminase